MTPSDLVLIAEDNPDDALLLRRAVQKAGIQARLKVVSDGEELLLYLEGKGAFANREACPMPSLVILDLKMPRKSGLEVLQWMAKHPHLAIVPTIVLSASNLPDDVRSAYDLGANTYFVKPTTFDELVETMRMVDAYWHKAMKVRPGGEGDGLSREFAARWQTDQAT